MSEPFAPTIGVSSDPDAQPSQSAGTAVLEREELQSTDDGDADRFAHYVRKDKIAAASTTGRPVSLCAARCGLPDGIRRSTRVCPHLQTDIRDDEARRRQGRRSRFPRFPFSRGGR